MGHSLLMRPRDHSVVLGRPLLFSGLTFLTCKGRKGGGRLKRMVAKVFLGPALRGKVTWWESCKERSGETLEVSLAFLESPVSLKF